MGSHKRSRKGEKVTITDVCISLVEDKGIIRVPPEWVGRGVRVEGLKTEVKYYPKFKKKKN